jgi:hypothetical protein
MKDRIKGRLLKGCGESFKSWLDTRISSLDFIDNPTVEDIKKDKKIQEEHDKQFICGNKKLCSKCKIRLDQHEETKKLYSSSNEKTNKEVK